MKCTCTVQGMPSRMPSSNCASLCRGWAAHAAVCLICAWQQRLRLLVQSSAHLMSPHVTDTADVQQLLYRIGPSYQQVEDGGPGAQQDECGDHERDAAALVRDDIHGCGLQGSPVIKRVAGASTLRSRYKLKLIWRRAVHCIRMGYPLRGCADVALCRRGLLPQGCCRHVKISTLTSLPEQTRKLSAQLDRPFGPVYMSARQSTEAP